MTNYVINDNSYDTSANNSSALTLNNGDNVIVTAAGSLIASGTGDTYYAVDGLVLGGNNSVLIQGTVYGTGTGIYDLVSVSGAQQTINVDGTVFGQNFGIYIAAGSTASTISVTIGATGLVAGGVAVSGQTVDLIVNGQVSGGVAANGGFNTFIEGAAGSISGDIGYDVDVGSSAVATINGNIAGTATGVLCLNSALNLNIGTTATVAGDDDAGIAIETSASTIISNAGLIEGATGIMASVYDSAPSEITLRNSGTIQDGINFAASSYDTITNAHGTISGVVTLGNYDAVTNSDGTIGNGLVFDEGDVLTNSGAIDGGIQAGGGAVIENTGTITGGIADLNATADTIGNMGRILGLISEQAATLTNSGTMHGEVYFATQSTLDNSGMITGNVIFNGTGDTVTNSGTIHGLVTLGTGDSFVNSGAIHGGLDLGTSDTLNMSTGSISGTIVANLSDTFDFSGSFGKYEITGFVPDAGHATSYDVMDFASDDFSTYAELQSHMAQVGKDVVITLDPTDDIVLVGVKLAALNAHDFLFT